ncbi:MAG: dihydropteroate synthase [Proteobacteria bacterium]|nr:dihydropteroate synthase [Desulfobacula sp.]MBU3952682.1 dihydropteroate synthase [Pseudomonadota bacterium]MBU4130513.1 dihydropteroate synthase [Pseudomonadota bacterium]
MKLVADNIRITKFIVREGLRKKDPAGIAALAQACVRNGAHAIDVNTGPLGKACEEDMVFLVRTIEQVTDLPLLIDTTNPLAMAAGLAAARNKTIINGISLERSKLAAILPLAKKFDVDLIGFLLYPDSRVPKDSSERCGIALELLARVEEAGVAKERLIIDPVVPPLSWDDGLFRARELLKTIFLLPELLGFPVRTIAGLSNLTTGAADPSRKTLVEASFLSMLAAAGLDYLMLDILNPLTRDAALAATMLTRGEIFSWESLP